MKQYKNILNRNNIVPSKYTIKGKTIIVDSELGKFTLKKITNNNIYKYLHSRKYDYFPRVIDELDNIMLFEYIDDVDYDEAEKALDLVHYLALLHSKTSYYKEIDLDEYKNLYEEIKNKIEYIYNYYLDVINIIESKVYMSPSEYLVARNISEVFSCIFYCKRSIDEWYELVKDKKRKRVVTLHNNVNTDHILKNGDTYLISWDKSKVDIPIYDFVNFYNNRALDFDFEALLKEYENIYPLLEEEKKLLFILVALPNKILICDNEYDMVKQVRKILDKIYKTEFLLTPKEEKKDTKTKE